MKLLRAVERFSASSLRVDLTSAFAAGSCAAILSCLINKLYYPVNLPLYVKLLLIALGSYLTVGSLMHWFWRGLLRRIMPTWILIAVVGSILFVAIDLMPGVIKGWTDPYRREQSLIEYISTEVDAAMSVIIILIFVTLPITAIFHYAGTLVRAVTSWHDGPKSPSILSKVRPRK